MSAYLCKASSIDRAATYEVASGPNLTDKHDILVLLESVVTAAPDEVDPELNIVSHWHSKYFTEHGFSDLIIIFFFC